MSPASEEQQAPADARRGRTVPRLLAVPFLALLVLALLGVAGYAVSLRGDVQAARDDASRASDEAGSSAALLTKLRATADDLRSTRDEESARLESAGWTVDPEPGVYFRFARGEYSDLCPEGGCVPVIVRTDSVQRCPEKLEVFAYVTKGDDLKGKVTRSAKNVKAGSTRTVLFEPEALEAGDGIQIISLTCT
jgi:hypothetical protein